jgi:hypothetical protein
MAAVMDWLRANYTLDENPGLGLEGLYYYYHTMAEALALYGADTLVAKGGKSINWREQLARRLIRLQQADGSWANENGRWWEKDPALVTSYALVALEIVDSVSKSGWQTHPNAVRFVLRIRMTSRSRCAGTGPESAWESVRPERRLLKEQAFVKSGIERHRPRDEFGS